MRKMKGKEQMQNMKPHVSQNGCKTIPNDVVGSNTFPNMGTIKKVCPY
jgi:hypothetical protein